MGPELVSRVCVEAQAHKKAAKASFAIVSGGDWWQCAFERDFRDPVCFAVCSFLSMEVQGQQPVSLQWGPD